MTAPLLELQAADTMADQLRHRRANLLEREQLQATKNDLIRWDQTLQTIRRRLDELNAEVERAEQRSHAIDTKKSKLQAQLKTVIAPREAEALQSGIAALDRERAELDDVELAALDEQSRLDDELQGLLANEETLRKAFLGADAALSTAQTDIDGELARIGARLQGLRDAVDANVLKQYDRLRQHHVVAAGGLSGSRCDGCHLDLSAVELDEVRATAAETDGIAECPHCGRLLLV
jgi:predicted  nucleic acid-binding Zn-ribbon protein